MWDFALPANCHMLFIKSTCTIDINLELTNVYFEIICQEILGYVVISLADVVNNKRINEKYHLIDSKNGRIQVELQWRSS